MSNQMYSRTRPKRPHTGPSWKRPDFAPYAVVFEDRVILRTPYDQPLIDALKQIPSALRAFVKDGRPLERSLREHLEANAEYFSSDDGLASSIESLVNCIAASNGLSDSWTITLAAPELFDWSVGSALKSFPELQLFDVRILEGS
jgi:hypothetical protein